MTLTAIIKDLWYTQCTGESSPFARTVHIELTPEQVEKLGLKQVSRNKEKPVYETIINIFIEDPIEQ